MPLVVKTTELIAAKYVAKVEPLRLWTTRDGEDIQQWRSGQYILLWRSSSGFRNAMCVTVGLMTWSYNDLVDDRRASD